MKYDKVMINWNDLASIDKAEIKKRILENDGYEMYRETSQINTSTLYYRKTVT